MVKIDYAIRLQILEAIYKENKKTLTKVLHRTTSYITSIKEGLKQPSKELQKTINRRFNYYSKESKAGYAIQDMYSTKTEREDGKLEKDVIKINRLSTISVLEKELKTRNEIARSNILEKAEKSPGLMDKIKEYGITTELLAIKTTRL